MKNLFTLATHILYVNAKPWSNAAEDHAQSRTMKQRNRRWACVF